MIKTRFKKLLTKIHLWLFLQVKGGYRPSDIQRICIEEFKEVYKQLDVPKEPVKCRYYCPYCKYKKRRK